MSFSIKKCLKSFELTTILMVIDHYLKTTRMWDQMLFNELVVLALHFDCSIVPENMQTTC
jgi:hypothetical protein